MHHSFRLTFLLGLCYNMNNCRKEYRVPLC
nr:MAG TPA: hypothetical protein [Caudoviricetes sp.]